MLQNNNSKNLDKQFKIQIEMPHSSFESPWKTDIHGTYPQTARAAEKIEKIKKCIVFSVCPDFRFLLPVRAAGIFHKIYSRKRNLFSGSSQWRQGMFVAVFLLLFFSAVSIFLSRHFFLLTINYIYIQLQLFLYKIWSDLVGNLLGTEWMSNSNPALVAPSLESVQDVKTCWFVIKFET